MGSTTDVRVCSFFAAAATIGAVALYAGDASAEVVTWNLDGAVQFSEEMCWDWEGPCDWRFPEPAAGSLQVTFDTDARDGDVWALDAVFTLDGEMAFEGEGYLTVFATSWGMEVLRIDLFQEVFGDDGSYMTEHLETEIHFPAPAFPDLAAPASIDLAAQDSNWFNWETNMDDGSSQFVLGSWEAYSEPEPEPIAWQFDGAVSDVYSMCEMPWEGCTCAYGDADAATLLLAYDVDAAPIYESSWRNMYSVDAQFLFDGVVVFEGEGTLTMDERDYAEIIRVDLVQESFDTGDYVFEHLETEIHFPVGTYDGLGLPWDIDISASHANWFNWETMSGMMNYCGVVGSWSASGAPGGADSDGDGVADVDDICPGGDDNIDTDGDTVPDACDGCPLDNPDDPDGDNVCESVDNCPGTANADQTDSDGDGYGDVCEPDDDGDGLIDDYDNCPMDPNADQADYDGDGVGDACDFDLDGDGVLDQGDVCLQSPVGEVVDTNGCTVDQTCPCDNGWKNHGGYVSCVAQAVENLVDLGLLSDAEGEDMVSTAAGTTCGKKSR